MASLRFSGVIRPVRLRKSGSFRRSGMIRARRVAIAPRRLYARSPLLKQRVRALMRKGHKVEFADGPYGGYQAIMRDHAQGVYVGASESRKDGQAAGY